MDCPTCKDLERAFEARLGSYIAARSAAYYRASTELAAYKNVEMERAKSDLEEHQLVCVFSASGRWASRLDFAIFATTMRQPIQARALEARALRELHFSARVKGICGRSRSMK